MFANYFHPWKKYNEISIFTIIGYCKHAKTQWICAVETNAFAFDLLGTFLIDNISCEFKNGNIQKPNPNLKGVVLVEWNDVAGFMNVYAIYSEWYIPDANDIGNLWIQWLYWISMEPIFIYISGMNLCINILAFRFQINDWGPFRFGAFFRIHSTFRNIFICPIKTNVCPIAYLQSPFTIYASDYIGIYSACDCGIFHS